MDQNSITKVKLDMDDEMKTLEKLYPTNIMFYNEPPDNELTLNEFNDLAIERLRVLRILEKSGCKNVRMYTKQWKEMIVDEFNVDGLKNYVRLLQKGEARKRSQFEARKRDYTSHFIMRMVYCNNDSMIRWFISREMELFRLKFLDSTAQDIKQFLKVNNLEYTPITDEEKNEIREGLNDSTMGQDASKIDLLDFYKVPFVEVLDLIKSRRCFVKAGYAYVNSIDFISVLSTKHQAIIEKGLGHANACTKFLAHDERFTNLMKNLHSSYTGNEFTLSKDAFVPIESLDQLSKKSFPLCMRYTHDALRSKHHLKHSGRMQYGLFLKGIGVTLEDSLKFWRQEFTKNIDPDKFDKQYAYNIRHNYGKAGSMRDYAPYSCQKIINTAPPPQDICGCPYKLFDGPTLRQKLTSYGLGMVHINDVANIATKGHYQLACAKYFETVHETTLEQGINHPNHYFTLSQEIIDKRQVTGGSAAKKRNLQNNNRMNASASTSTQTMATQSTQSQASQSQATQMEDELDAFMMDVQY